MVHGPVFAPLYSLYSLHVSKRTIGNSNDSLFKKIFPYSQEKESGMFSKVFFHLQHICYQESCTNIDTVWQQFTLRMSSVKWGHLGHLDPNSANTILSTNPMGSSGTL